MHTMQGMLLISCCCYTKSCPVDYSCEWAAYGSDLNRDSIPLRSYSQSLCRQRRLIIVFWIQIWLIFSTYFADVFMYFWFLGLMCCSGLCHSHNLCSAPIFYDLIKSIYLIKKIMYTLLNIHHILLKINLLIMWSNILVLHTIGVRGRLWKYPFSVFNFN